MTKTRFSVIALGAVFLLSICTPAFADGGSEMTPLDKAIEDIQNKDPPVVVQPAATPAPAAAPAPAAEPAAAPEETKAPEAAPAAPATVSVKQEPSPAAPLPRVVEVQPDTAFFGLSIGMYNPFQSRKKSSGSLNVEWHPGVKIVGVLQPIFGAFVTTDGAMMGYGGVGTPFHLGKHIFVMPSFGVGGYVHGDSMDLKQALAFRAGGEISYEFDDKSRFGINAHIISNGRSTNGDDNAAMIGLVYTTPIDFLSGRPRPDTRAADKAALEKPSKSVK